MEDVGRIEDDGDEGPLLRSSTPTGLWETGEKTDFPCKTCRRLKIALWVLSSFLVCSIAVLVLLDAYLPPSSPIAALPAPEQTFTTALGRNTRYMSTDNAVDELWNVYLEQGLGEFATPDSQWDHGEFSMFHQLRCLARFRLAIQRASEGEDVGTDFHGGHWAHCLDYMRRIILCNADDTIEMPRIALPQPDGTVHHGIEGAEEPRTCRSVQPMCDVLAQRGVSSKLCVAELNNTLLPWPGLSSR